MQKRLIFKYLKIICLLFFIFGVVTAFPMDIGELRSIYMNGVIALSENNLKIAEGSFVSIIKSADSSSNTVSYIAKSYYYLAEISFIRQDYESSIKYYKIVVQKYFREDIYTKAMYKLGRTYVISRYYDEGIFLLKDYLANYGNNDSLEDSALYWIGKGYAGKGDISMALSIFNQILIQYPDSGLAFELRNTIEAFNKIAVTSRVQDMEKSDNPQFRNNRNRTAEEKALLQSMAKLLEIKQKLLEIKAEKVELLSKLRERDQGISE